MIRGAKDAYRAKAEDAETPIGHPGGIAQVLWGRRDQGLCLSALPCLAVSGTGSEEGLLQNGRGRLERGELPGGVVREYATAE
jgi:hypothetical protein